MYLKKDGKVPKSNLKRTSFKKRRREWEFDLITTAIKNNVADKQLGKLWILEFGSGPSGGAKYLCELGNLVVTDVYKHPLLELPPNVEFKIEDIHHTSFKDGHFDILVSNQVIEHLENIEVAFQEMKRISKPDAYFFFAIPTATWLLLTVPGQLYKRVENFYNKIRKVIRIQEHQSDINTNSEPDNNYDSIDQKKINKSFWDKFSIGGHGCYQDFSQCYKFFRLNNWRSVFQDNGFRVISELPLLSYGSSHLPIIPTNRLLARLGLASSYLFVCKKAYRKGKKE